MTLILVKAINRLMPHALELWRKNQNKPTRPPLAKEVQNIQEELVALEQSSHPVQPAL
jgi:hypothetical protein